MGSATKTTHKGAIRRYWCPKAFDDSGKIPSTVTVPPECWQSFLVKDGEVIPVCPMHGEAMKKTRYKRVEDRQRDAYERSKLQIGDTCYWSDVAVRKAKCHLCLGQVERGERRIAIDSGSRGRMPIKTMAGGVIARTRAYVHASCFIDMIFGGKAGDGCPGCSAKILHDEFTHIRDLLQLQYGQR